MNLASVVFPSRYVEPWRPAVCLEEIWWTQLTAEQQYDAACVQSASLMTTERFWDIVSRPSILRTIRREWRMLPRGY